MTGHAVRVPPLFFALLLWPGATLGQNKPTKYATIEPGITESIHRVHFSPTGDSLAYVYSGKTIATWHTKAKEHRKQLHKADVIFLDMAFSPDGRTLVASDLSDVYQIDVQTGKRTLLYQHLDKDRPGHVHCLRYSPDGKRVISADRTVNVWDVEKRNIVATIDCQGFAGDLTCIPGSEHALAIVEESSPHPDKPNTTVIDLKVRLIDLNARTVKTVRDSVPPVMSQQSAAARDGRLVALPFGEDVRVLATSSWKPADPAPPKCPVDPNACVFSDSGRLLIAGGSTKGVHSLVGPPGEIAILDLASNKWTGPVRVLDREVTSMALSPRNNLLAVASSKLGTITVWDLSPVIDSLPKAKAETKPDAKRR